MDEKYKGYVKVTCDYTGITHMKKNTVVQVCLLRKWQFMETATCSPLLPHQWYQLFWKCEVWPHWLSIELLFRFMIPLNILKKLWRQGMYSTVELLWHEGSLCNKKSCLLCKTEVFPVKQSKCRGHCLNCFVHLTRSLIHFH